MNELNKLLLEFFTGLKKLIKISTRNILNKLTSRYKTLSKTKQLGVIAGIFLAIQIFCVAPLFPSETSKIDPTNTLITRQFNMSLTQNAMIATVSKSLATNTPIPTAAPTYTPISMVPSYPCITDKSPQIGKVIKVTDGDTIDVLIDGTIYPVRYIGMDTPESTFEHEPLGDTSSQANSILVANQQVTLYRDHRETDDYDRLLRYVFVGDLFINNELVKMGYAEAKDYPPDTSCSSTFHETMQIAKNQQIGMWASTTETLLPNLTLSPMVALNSGGSVSIAIVKVNKQSEYVVIHNNGSEPIDLTGWHLLSEKGFQNCSLGGIIAPGADLTIYAMTGTNGYNCYFTNNIWNNSSSDPAVLYDPQGNEIDRK